MTHDTDDNDDTEGGGSPLVGRAQKNIFSLIRFLLKIRDRKKKSKFQKIFAP